MKKVYFVFKGEKFIGFIKEKKILKRFLSERGERDYNIHEIKEYDLANILNSSQIESLLLDEFREFGKIMTMIELSYIYHLCQDYSMGLNFYFMDLLRLKERVRFTKEEKKVLQAFTQMLEDILGDLLEMESCATPYEYFDRDLLFEIAIQRY